MGKDSMPVLLPMELDEFWERVGTIVRECLREVMREKVAAPLAASVMETPGLTEKPLFRISEVCRLFGISRPTVNAWVEEGKLRKVKIGGKVFFIGSEIRALMQGEK